MMLFQLSFSTITGIIIIIINNNTESLYFYKVASFLRVVLKCMSLFNHVQVD